MHFRRAGVEIESAEIRHGLEQRTERLILGKYGRKVKNEPATKHPVLKSKSRTALHNLAADVFKKFSPNFGSDFKSQADIFNFIRLLRRYKKAERKTPLVFSRNYYKVVVEPALKNPLESNLAYWALYRTLVVRGL